MYSSLRGHFKWLKYSKSPGCSQPTGSSHEDQEAWLEADAPGTSPLSACDVVAHRHSSQMCFASGQKQAPQRFCWHCEHQDMQTLCDIPPHLSQACFSSSEYSWNASAAVLPVGGDRFVRATQQPLPHSWLEAVCEFSEAITMSADAWTNSCAANARHGRELFWSPDRRALFHTVQYIQYSL